MTLQNGDPSLLPAKQFSVWTRLYNRFLLEPGPAVGANAWVSPVIQPITDADRLLRTPTTATDTEAVAAIGWVVFHTVPKGDRWTMGFMRASRGSGTMTHNTFGVTPPGGTRMVVAEYTQEAEGHLHEFNQGVELDEGWTVEAFINTHSGAGDMVVVIMYDREEAF